MKMYKLAIVDESDKLEKSVWKFEHDLIDAMKPQTQPNPSIEDPEFGKHPQRPAENPANNEFYSGMAHQLAEYGFLAFKDLEEDGTVEDVVQILYDLVDVLNTYSMREVDAVFMSHEDAKALVPIYQVMKRAFAQKEDLYRAIMTHFIAEGIISWDKPPIIPPPQKNV